MRPPAVFRAVRRLIPRATPALRALSHFISATAHMSKCVSLTFTSILSMRKRKQDHNQNEDLNADGWLESLHSKLLVLSVGPVGNDWRQL